MWHLTFDSWHLTFDIWHCFYHGLLAESAVAVDLATVSCLALPMFTVARSCFSIALWRSQQLGDCPEAHAPKSRW